MITERLINTYFIQGAIYLTEVSFWYNRMPLKLGSGKKIDQKTISNLDFIEVLLQSPSENDIS